LLVVVFATTYVSINAMNYLGWNPVGARTVDFLQGRYFIPIAPLAFLLLTNRRLSSVVSADRLTRASAFFALLTVLLAGFYLVRRWHGA